MFIFYVICHVFLLSISSYPDNNEVVEKIKSLEHNTRYTLKDSFQLNFDTHHPQGMAILGNRIYLSSVQVIDRKKGEGIGHLFELNLKGKLLRHIEWSDGSRYHPSGMDFDGKYLWIALAEYSPDSTSSVYRVNPNTMFMEKMFQFSDHLGGLVHHPELNLLLGVNWGSRTFYKWNMDSDGKAIDPDNPKSTANPNHYIDFQDIQWLPETKYIVLGGLKGYRLPGKRSDSISLGGIDLYDLEKGSSVLQLPISLWSKKGRPMNQNPFYILNTDNGLEFYFIPDDNPSTLYIYETTIQQSP